MRGDAAEPEPPAEPVRVGCYRARGVAEDALQRATAALEADGGFDVAVVTPRDVRRGRLGEHDVVFFSGGVGSTQGRTLGEDGRAAVRDFLRGGGGYVGICAGAYLAIQGAPRYHHLAIVAARSWSADAWRRGVGPVEIRPAGGAPALALQYANGPVFRREEVRGLAPYVTLAEFVSDRHCEPCGTMPGEMPGTPAILAAGYGDGRIVLFSPNPVLEVDGDRARPDLLADAVRWAARGGGVDPGLRWEDVFP